MAKCAMCEKHAVSGNAVSHSQIHTKRKFKPNLQKVYGVVMCTRCIKTLKKLNSVKHLDEETAVEAVEEIKEEEKSSFASTSAEATADKKASEDLREEAKEENEKISE